MLLVTREGELHARRVTAVVDALQGERVRLRVVSRARPDEEPAGDPAARHHDIGEVDAGADGPRDAVHHHGLRVVELDRQRRRSRRVHHGEPARHHHDVDAVHQAALEIEAACLVLLGTGHAHNLVELGALVGVRDDDGKLGAVVSGAGVPLGARAETRRVLGLGHLQHAGVVIAAGTESCRVSRAAATEGDQCQDAQATHTPGLKAGGNTNRLLR
mmetsp:Transcript_133323/g.371668  ORF Transcript_133323/g.371668 Transcript_133323/m.371668 type:complete len:216 (+) Transcript_133323:686-1333(+)